MAKSPSRNKAEGKVDTIAGRVMEAFAKLSGKRSSGAKGKAARGRGTLRKTKGRAKQAKYARRHRVAIQAVCPSRGG